MSDSMYFSHTVDEFMESHKMVDSEEIYSNGIEYVPIFRMKQWFNENPNVINHDAKVRADAIDECIDILNNSIPLVDNTDIVFGFKCAIERLEQLKEKK